MRKLISFLLALFLMTAPLSSLAEGVPANPAAPVNPAGGTGTTVNVVSEDAQNVLHLDVKYAEAEWDGLLHVTVAVSWPGTNAQAAKNAKISIELFEGLEMEEGEMEISLGDISAGGTKTAQFTLRYDHSLEKPDYIPEPEMILTAWADETGYTRYTARMDGTTIPRAMVMGWELTDVGPRAIQADVNMMLDIWNQSYYNRRPFEVEGALYTESSYESVMGGIAGWDEDENDVTYIYLNVHSAVDSGHALPVFYAITDNTSVTIDGKTYTDKSMVTYESMLSYLDQVLNGRVVIIAEICYAGQMLIAAKHLGLDDDKFSIMTSSQANTTSKLWPDRFDLNDLDTTGGKLLGWADLPEVNSLFSYGWFTNDLCDLLDAGYAEDEHGVVTVSEAYSYIHDASYALKLRRETAFKDTNDENWAPTNISGLDDLFDTADVWKERIFSLLNSPYLEAFLMLDKVEPHEWIKQVIMLAEDYVNPMFAGNGDTLLYCSESEYDDNKRMLVVLEEEIEYLDPVELYYAYLREWVVPEIGVARRDDPVVGDLRWDAEFWADLLYNQGASGLMSAMVCDLDKNGSLDMITLSVMPREQALIEATGVYYSVNLDMYQIEKGQVVRSDQREDIIIVNEKHRSLWSHMTFRMHECDSQITFTGKGYYTAGNSYDGGMHFTCGFRDGKIADAPDQPGAYTGRYRTEDGREYKVLPSEIGEYLHMGEGVAFLEYGGEYYYETGYLYNAEDYTKLYEYIFGYEKPQVFKPMKLILQPAETPSPAQLRRAAVEAGVEQAVGDAMAEAGKEAYQYSLSCSRDTGEARQMIIYSNEVSFDSVDTGKLKAMALAALRSSEINASAEAVSAMEGLELSKKRVEASAGGCRFEFVMIPDGTYALMLNLNE